VDEHARALDVAQELVAQAAARMRALDQPGDVGQDKIVVVDHDHAQHRHQCRKRVVGDLGLGRANYREQGGLAGVGHADDAGIGDELELQAQPVFLARLAVLGDARGLVGGAFEDRVAAATAAQEFDLVANRTYVDENVNRRFFLTDETYLGIPGNKHLLDVAHEHADKELGILAFCPPGPYGRRPFGLILNYTMHPLTAGNTSTLISADVPGVVRAIIRESMGCPACYITGAAGDNHPKASEAGFAETRRVGQVLGTEAVRRSSDGYRIPGPVHLRCLTRTVPLRYRTYDDFLRIPLHGVDEGVLTENFKRVEQPGAAIDVEFSLLAIGPVLLIGVPGEMLAELGSVLKWFSPFKRTYIMYQATESFDYIAHPNAFLWGGFEIICAQLSPDSVRPLINAIIDAAEELSRQPAGEGGDQA